MNQKNTILDPRVEAYVSGRMNAEEEQQFCEELLQSSELQRQVSEMSMLRQGLLDQPAVARRRPVLRWAGYAAAGVVGMVAGALFFNQQPAPEQAVISGVPFTLAGEVRGEGDEPLVLPRMTPGVTVLLPVGRCSKISTVHVIGPDGKSIARSGGMSDMPGFTISLRDPEPGTYFAEVAYADCAPEVRSFVVPPTRAELESKAAFFQQSWTIEPSPTTSRVKPGGSITFEIDMETSDVTISAGKMEGKEAIWNSVEDAVLGPMGESIEGTLVAGLKIYRFTVSRSGEQIQGHVEQETSAKTYDDLGDDGDGDWMGGNGAQ